MASVDGAGEYSYADAAVERLLGHSPDALVGRDALECVHPSARERVRAAVEPLAGSDGGRTETLEYRYWTAAGGWVRLEGRLSPASDDGRGGYVDAARDVTDRNRAEERDHEGEARLRETAANAEDLLWLFSADWEELLLVDDAYEEIYGQSVEALAAGPEGFPEVIHPGDRPRVRRVVDRLSAGEPTDLECRVDPDRNYRRWVWVEGRPVVEGGEVARIAGFSHDITDRRRRERQLRVMDNLLGHDLRNDRNAILGHAEVAREGADPASPTAWRRCLRPASDCWRPRPRSGR